MSVSYDVRDGVATISLDRATKRNAQDIALLYALNDAFDRSAADPEARVIVLRGEGPDFSAGHDLRDQGELGDHRTVGTWQQFDLPAAEGYMAREEEIYYGLCRRWFQLPKPTIASVQGRSIAGGLMLMWVCDLIVAAETATFCDPTVGMGVNGVEWLAHPWELGHRKAKELLFTGDWFDAHEAHRLGMVNRVVADADLDQHVHALAAHIATKPTFGLKLAKQSINDALDAQGFATALRSAFGLHQLAHSHNRERFGMLIDPSGFPAAVKKE